MAHSHQFGLWMKAQRKLLDLTQEALARQVGCAAVTIKQIESGQRRPSRQLAELLALSLDIPADERDAFARAARSSQVAPPPAADEPAAFSAGLPVGPGQLPLPPTPFIGRGEEIALLQPRLLRQDVRLLTLIGPPGVGKTRLAIQLAASASDAFAHGVVFVPLAPVREAGQVLGALGRSLGYQEGDGQGLLARLQRTLRNRQLLLMFDNFEHVSAAASQIGELLSGAPHLKLLVTSRTPLLLYGEHEYIVAPLALPPLNPLPLALELARWPAVELFVARAQAVNAGFTLDSRNALAVAQLCHRLDGLPLALELAAGRLRLLTPDMLLQRMQNQLPVLTRGARDLPERQQTLWNAIDWSYMLLPEPERAILRRLAVFAGGWTLEAAEAIIEHATTAPGTGQATVVTGSLLDALTALVSQSLVVADTGKKVARYRLLEAIKEYALERLTACGELADTCSKHMAYYLSLFAGDLPQGVSEGEWRERLDQEQDNLRAALAWAVDHGPERVLQLADELGWFWQIQGNVREGRRWLELALTRTSASSTLQRAHVRAMIGFLAREMHDLGPAQSLLKESLEIYRQLGDREREAGALNTLAMIALSRGDCVATDHLASQSLTLFRALSDTGGVAAALLLVGDAAYLSQDYTRSQFTYSESLQLAREIGSTRLIRRRMLRLGQIALATGATASGTAQVIEVLHASKQANDTWCFTMALAALASAALALGDPRLSMRLLAATDGLLTRSGARLWPVDHAEYERTDAAVRTRLDKAIQQAEWAIGLEKYPEQMIGEVAAHMGSVAGHAQEAYSTPGSGFSVA
jgi:predicted ATPase/DNA-binding XRE family transcriptional regulator